MQQEDSMAIHKVIEVIAQSEKSWEDAAQSAVQDAAKTVKNIKSIWIKNAEGTVKNNQIVAFRVNANITFEVE
jgi:flavin-binding protein dodecin